MHPRLAEEWQDVLAAYPDARHEEEPERVELTLELDGSGYNRARTRTAVLVPPGYRTTAPDGFLIEAGLSRADGAGLPVSDASGIGMPGWLLVSFHYVDEHGRSTWRPGADPKRGDNLVSYVGSIESFLARGCN